MEWDEFKKYIDVDQIIQPRLEITDIKCPECGQYIYRRNDVVLTSYPPQFQYECKCGWVGYNWR